MADRPSIQGAALMANVSVKQNSNVTVQQIPDTTATAPAASSGTVTSTNNAYGTAYARSALLVVQIGIDNSLTGNANTVTTTVTDSHSNQSFFGQAEIDFAEQDDSTVFVQFSDFPLQADQVTPMDECDYRIDLVGSSASYQLFTV
jgi:hypothetical protein